jgi:hypothetical protein
VSLDLDLKAGMIAFYTSVGAMFTWAVHADLPEFDRNDIYIYIYI